MNGSTVPKHDVVLKHAATAQRRRDLLERLVGLEVIYLADHREDGSPVPGRLYPERIGSRCRIVSFNEHVAHCPLVVEWPGGEKGLAEPGWLMEVVDA